MNFAKSGLIIYVKTLSHKRILRLTAISKFLFIAYLPHIRSGYTMYVEKVL